MKGAVRSPQHHTWHKETAGRADLARGSPAPLIRRAQTGDHQAYALLVRRFQDMAVGYAYALLGDFHLAEDAAQEAFVGPGANCPNCGRPRLSPAGSAALSSCAAPACAASSSRPRPWETR
ncbi:MAG: hypothetical protein FJY95_02455 [Candidatus Handelsmanbacteria bacterium]|nr:hypothetical protein [Candidatus Handelsmanbacteria bacterium]